MAFIIKKSGQRNSDETDELDIRQIRQEDLNKKRKERQYIRQVIIKSVIFAAILFGLFSFVFCVKINYGNHMFPAVRDGDLAIAYRLDHNINNGDVVWYKMDGSLKLGRVVAQPGDIVEISADGVIKVNGGVTSEEVFYPTFIDEESSVIFPYTVPQGTVFILNDFRSDTKDSRIFGGVSLKDIAGKTVFVIRRRGI